jgi:hypothetical protein
MQRTLQRRKSQDNLPCLPDGTPCIDDYAKGSRYVFESQSPEARVPVLILKAIVVPPGEQGEVQKKGRDILPNIPARDLEYLVTAFIGWAESHGIRDVPRKSVRLYPIQD